MKAYVTSVGCEQRNLDAQRVINYLDKNGISLTDSPGRADYVFVFTCGVDKPNEEQSIVAIRNASSQIYGNGKLIVGGCVPSISPDRLDEFSAYHTFSPTELDTLDSLLGLEISISKIDYPNMSIFDETQKFGRTARERFEQAKRGYKVKIAEGCLSACSYCVIRQATKNLKSVEPNVVLYNIEQGVQQGESTMILMAGDTGAYGRDIGSSFPQLLEPIVQLPGEFQLYIHDFGIKWLIRDLSDYIRIFEEAESIHRFGGMTFPVQSGSDKILKAMLRGHDRTNALRSLLSLKKYSFYIGTHIIVGFPGETETDFDDTLDLLEKVDFDFITCFPYSEHPRARSVNIHPKVSQSEIDVRLVKISDLFEDKVKVLG